MPDAGLEAIVPRELLEGASYEVLAIFERAGAVHPG
jgi:hypothetical protein